ncbi:MAG: general secretion pathway protein GspB [Burkholderiaceae bacterium]
MSYILDALRRADAERERGQIPGLRSQSAPLNPSPVSRRGMPWWLPASLILAAGLAVAAWWLWPASGSGPADAPPAATPLSSGPVSSGPGAPGAPNAPDAAVTTAPAAAVPAPAPPSLPILAPVTPPVAASGPGKQAPAGKTGAGATPDGQPRTPSPAATAPTAATPPAQAATQALASPAPARVETRVPSFGELSADVRARLPKVSVSGATYSANPAHRMLIVNGQVVQEGAEIQPGLRLESIGPRSATLDHQGTRYSIGY